MPHHLQEGLENPHPKVCSIRLTLIEFARLILFWQTQGEIFQSRAQMLQSTIQEFLRQNKVRELTISEAIPIELDEFANYSRNSNQVAVHKIVSRFRAGEQEKLLERLERVKQESVETPINIEDLIEDD